MTLNQFKLTFKSLKFLQDTGEKRLKDHPEMLETSMFAGMVIATSWLKDAGQVPKEFSIEIGTDPSIQEMYDKCKKYN